MKYDVYNTEKEPGMVKRICIPISPEAEWMDYEFEITLSYIWRLCITEENKTNKKQW